MRVLANKPVYFVFLTDNFITLSAKVPKPLSWFSPFLREVFLRVLRFSPLLKNQHFQFPIRSGTHGHVSTSSYELLSPPWVNKLQFTIYNLQILNVHNNSFLGPVTIKTFEKQAPGPYPTELTRINEDFIQ